MTRVDLQYKNKETDYKNQRTINTLSHQENLRLRNTKSEHLSSDIFVFAAS